jgi:hypothetical protein
VRFLPRPADGGAAAFALCTSQVRDAALRARLTSVAGAIAHAEIDFDTLAAAATQYTIPTASDVGGVVTAEEMVNLYDRRMASARGVGRPIYDRIKAIPPGDICPLCAQRDVSTLDHHLPKTLHPALTVTPLNLVPACKDCNKAKGQKVAATAEEQTLHPYFDDIEETPWLTAEVLHTSPASLRFFVEVALVMHPILRERIEHHFATFELAKLYGVHAAVEVGNIRGRLKDLFATGGDVQVKAHLTGEWQSRRAVHMNSWQTATYFAVSHDDWFCGGGLEA